VVSLPHLQGGSTATAVVAMAVVAMAQVAMAPVVGGVMAQVAVVMGAVRTR